MPSLLSLGPGSTTGIDLSANAFWRLALGPALMDQQTMALALVLVYPPSQPGQTTDTSRIVLAKTPIPVARAVDEVGRVAAVSLNGGTFEADVARMTEAFQFFRNSGAVKQDLLQSSVAAAQYIISAYWSLRNWAEGGFKEEVRVDVNEEEALRYSIIGRP